MMMSMGEGGGGVGGIQQEELVLTPNILDTPSRMGACGNTVEMAPGQGTITDMVLGECKKLIAESMDKYGNIGELYSEIRKLKALIIKHETRIRSLEAKNLEQERILNNHAVHVDNGHQDNGSNLGL